MRPGTGGILGRMMAFAGGFVCLAGCAPPPVPGECPEGMALVPAGVFRFGSRRVRGFQNKENIATYCIDRYEFPNAAGAVPETGVTWVEAASKCRGLGKRLCTEYEWEKACRGRKGLSFPWGNEFDPAVCAPGAADGQHRSGARPWCVSPYGVYDMAGSVWEWTANAFDGDQSARVVRGGWDETLAPEDRWLSARCSYRLSADPARGEPRTGFRCCAPPRGE